MKGQPARLLRLCRKELQETLRDRRTIITLVLMPLLIYPILSMTLNRFLISGAAGNGTEIRFVVQAETLQQAEALQQIVQSPLAMPPEAIQAASGSEPPAEFDFYGEGDTTPAENLKTGRIDVAARTTPGPPQRFTLTALEGKASSQQARRILVERIQWFNAAVARRQLQAAAAQPIAPEIEVAVDDLESRTSTSVLASIVPLMLVLMTITGAVYPAIDLTAGERERGTIEAVIASPVSRGSLLFAKYIAVVTVALLTAVVNLVAMFTTLWLGGLLEILLGQDAAFPWREIAQVLVLLVLFAGFFSAVLLTLTSFARSFKEAQAYLIPLMLLALAPGVLSLLPGIELTVPLAVVPLINITLLTRDVFAGQAMLVPASVAIATTVLYAVAALSVAARLFGSDAILRSSERSIGSLLKRPDQPQATPTASGAVLTLAALFPVYFVTANVLSRLAPAAIEGRLIINAFALILVFGCVPAVAAWLARCRFRSTFSLQSPGIAGLVGGLLMGLSVWAFSFELMWLAESLGIRALDTNNLEMARETAERMQRASPLILLATFALTPGVIEEWFFRGYLFSAFRRQLSAAKTILVCALLFGLLHTLTGSVLTLERLVPSTFAGLFFGWLTYRTGSIFPAMVMHFTHDALMLMVIRYEGTLKARGWDISQGQHLPLTILVATGLLLAAGIALVAWRTSHRESPVPAEIATES